MGDWTGTVPSHAAGAKLRGADMQTHSDIETALTAAWTDWTPTLTNLTQGSGTVTARYRRLGKTVDFRFKFKYGAGSAVGTAPKFTLPVAPSSSHSTTDQDVLGKGTLLDSGAAAYQCDAVLVTLATGTVEVQSWNATPTRAQITATAPFTWTTNDDMDIRGTYETA